MALLTRPKLTIEAFYSLSSVRLGGSFHHAPACWFCCLAGELHPSTTTTMLQSSHPWSSSRDQIKCCLLFLLFFFLSLQVPFKITCLPGPRFGLPGVVLTRQASTSKASSGPGSHRHKQQHNSIWQTILPHAPMRPTWSCRKTLLPCQAAYRSKSSSTLPRLARTPPAKLISSEIPIPDSCCHTTP